MRYIDADRLRAEIERLIQNPRLDEEYNPAYQCGLRDLRAFLNTLSEEPEQPTRGYDEANLNEKIAKASKSWEGVDVDKYMDEVRGREPVSDCHDLEEAAKKYETKNTFQLYDGGGFTPEYDTTLADAFKAGAKWMAEQLKK